MPLHECGPGCWQYGRAGKKYEGPGAKRKARKQATAIAFSKARASGRRSPTSKDFR